MASEADLGPRRLLTAPLVPAALAMMAGIVADRCLDHWSTRAWALAAVGCAVATLIGRAHSRVAYPALLAACAALGGGWHHHRWSDLEPDDLASLAGSAARPAWLRGVLVDTPEFFPPTRPHDDGRTRSVLHVTGRCDGSRWMPAAGQVLLSLAGDRTDLVMGEAVEIAGSLAGIAGPLNPGEFDRRAYLRAQGIRLILTADDPASTWANPAGGSWPWTRLLGRARVWCHRHLAAAVDPRTAPLAAALLLGRREAVDPDVNDAFARTGTTHLLAISGLHLQVLAWALAWTCRLLGWPRVLGIALAAGATIAYSVLVGPMPSVVRSSAMTVAVCVAVLRARGTRPANVLALAALATLLSNPANLFDVGCQLSFLAVAALFWGVAPVGALLRRPLKPLDALERSLEPFPKTALRWGALWIVEGVLISTVVWLITLPLTSLRFHLASPVSVLLNLPLVPITSLALMLAGLTLGLSAVWSPLGWPTGWACSQLLLLTERLVRWGAGLSWGHFWLPGPSAAWVMTFYLVLPLAGVAWAARWRGLRIVLSGASAVALCGLLASMYPRSPRTLEAEVLAVGHGLAVIAQSSPGRAVVYDCGRMGDPHVGRRLIAPALWARGVSRLDAVILSHADADHYNGLPDLLDRFHVGMVLVPVGFAGAENPAAQDLLRLVRRRGVAVRTLAAGDRLDLGHGASARVLHPPESWPSGGRDNDRSLVIDLERGARHLLLTGDLDGSGLTELVAQPAVAVDAMLSPHHGGRTANPIWLYNWAHPRVVIVSQRPLSPGSRDPLITLDRRIAVSRTWAVGAVTMRWMPGAIDLRTFVDEGAYMSGVRTTTRATPGSDSR
jgi:competence protein ComEC